jgi:hypothetical protein
VSGSKSCNGEIFTAPWAVGGLNYWGWELRTNNRDTDYLHRCQPLIHIHKHTMDTLTQILLLIDKNLPLSRYSADEDRSFTSLVSSQYLHNQQSQWNLWFFWPGFVVNHLTSWLCVQSARDSLCSTNVNNPSLHPSFAQFCRCDFLHKSRPRVSSG